MPSPVAEFNGTDLTFKTVQLFLPANPDWSIQISGTQAEFQAALIYNCLSKKLAPLIHSPSPLHVPFLRIIIMMAVTATV